MAEICVNLINLQLPEFEGVQTSVASTKQIIELAFPIEPCASHARLPKSETLPYSPITIRLRVDATDGCGGHAWAAGEMLASYIARQGPDFVRGKKILELGSGTGLVGLAVGLLGGNITITDQTPMLKLMRENIEFNDLQKLVHVQELNWGESISQDLQRPDLVLAADCVYYEPTFPMLVQTLRDIVELNTEVLFCYAKRRKADRRFFILLGKYFTWEEVAADEDKPLSSTSSIYLYRIKRKNG